MPLQPSVHTLHDGLIDHILSMILETDLNEFFGTSWDSIYSKMALHTYVRRHTHIYTY